MACRCSMSVLVLDVLNVIVSSIPSQLMLMVLVVIFNAKWRAAAWPHERRVNGISADITVL